MPSPLETQTGQARPDRSVPVRIAVMTHAESGSHGSLVPYSWVRPVGFPVCAFRSLSPLERNTAGG